MGCYDVFCPICGICVFIPKNDLDKKYTSKIKWIKKASFMTTTNEISCSNFFIVSENRILLVILFTEIVMNL